MSFNNSFKPSLVIEEIMRRRINKVLRIGASNNHDGIVLGAWGCGAYGNDPWLIAGLFKSEIDNNSV